MARTGRPRRVRFGHGERKPHATVTCASSHGDHAAHGPVSARQRIRCLGRDGGWNLTTPFTALSTQTGPRRWDALKRVVHNRAAATLEVHARGWNANRTRDFNRAQLAHRGGEMARGWWSG